jgi:hypothetical protein
MDVEDEDSESIRGHANQMVHFEPFTEIISDDLPPLLHIIVQVAPEAFLRIKDSLLEIIDSPHPPTGDHECQVKVEMITSESSIFHKLWMQPLKGRFEPL